MGGNFTWIVIFEIVENQYQKSEKKVFNVLTDTLALFCTSACSPGNQSYGLGVCFVKLDR